ncbi:putative glutaredoxin-C14 [Dioscorea cayenensis subsp. rotundata]|uniref:Glutaredoxin-C14 n=1 Tax=Dioscorea cayennensis subsp. rotundata TaxID=55577 RepID=A0AB40BGZ5_DIOCR|nr:putative glutaredoxin-C14 [Dioscorea cayenensis subsp. rotundata]
MDIVTSLVSQRAVVIFSKSSCYMCYTVKRLFTDLGVNVSVHELDQDPNGKEIERALINLLGKSSSVPAVFISGKFIGYTEKVMSLHLSGDLMILLRNAGAIWL